MSSGSLKDVHWLIDLLQTIEVGIVVLDADNCVRLWNGFMENHSGIAAEQAVGQDLFALFDDLPRAWLERKLSAVRLLHTRSFSVWEQRPYLFRFRNRRPITGSEPLMFQNITIKFNLRQPDIAGRYGGEEFAVILPETDLDGARIFAERMREVVEQQIIQWADVPLQITVSLGVAPLSETYHRSDHWLKAADEALYRAKGSGRNQVVVAGE